MKILSKKKPIDLFCEASSILNEAVIHTLGPKGTNTAIQNERGMYEIINDRQNNNWKINIIRTRYSSSNGNIKTSSVWDK